MLNKITKEEFDIYNYVSDNLEEYIHNQKLLKKNNEDYKNILYNIFFGILIIFSLIFFYHFNEKNKKEEKSDDNLKCHNGFCYKTL